MIEIIAHLKETSEILKICLSTILHTFIHFLPENHTCDAKIYM